MQSEEELRIENIKFMMIMHKACDVVNMFDQANKLGALDVGMGNMILKKNIEELRALLNRDEQRTYLTAEEAEKNKQENLKIGQNQE